MCGFVAEISGGQQPIVRQLFFYSQVPLLDVRGTCVLWNIDVDAIREERGIRAVRECRGEHRDRLTGIRRVKTATRVGDLDGTAERRVVCKAVEVEDFGVVIENRIA